MEYKGAGIIATFEIKYDGASIRDYHNTHAPVARDDTIGALLPDRVCKCSLARRDKEVCLSPGVVEKIARRLLNPAGSRASSLEDTMRALMSKTRCTDEKCVLAAAREMQLLSATEAGLEEQLAFKREGPTDASLFNDSVIQAQLYAWMFEFRDFWAYNFNMLNWREMSLRGGRVRKSPDTLATIDWCDLYKGKLPEPIGMVMSEAARAMLARKSATGVRCSGCVINSDVYEGQGKHWMALFVDARESTWTIEFFNSAAVRPESEWVEWLAKTKIELQRCAPSGTKIETICVCKIWHQHSRSECGPYSLFYIWARLNKIPAQYFLENVVPDQMMFEFRQHLFNETDAGKAFDMKEYAAKVKVKWDTEDISHGDKKRTNI